MSNRQPKSCYYRPITIHNLVFSRKKSLYIESITDFLIFVAKKQYSLKRWYLPEIGNTGTQSLTGRDARTRSRNRDCPGKNGTYGKPNHICDL